eukprot:7685245-Alexandrium_andersonii.AAC.1
MRACACAGMRSRAHAHACVRACVRACVLACVRARERERERVGSPCSAEEFRTHAKGQGERALSRIDWCRRSRGP